MTDNDAGRFVCEGCGGTVVETRYCDEARVGPHGRVESAYLCEDCHPDWDGTPEVAA